MWEVSIDAVRLLSICIATAMISFSLKGVAPAFAVIVAMCGGFFVILNLLDGVAEIIGAVENAASKAEISGEVVNFAIKGVGLSWLTGFVSDTARSVGEEGLGKKAELVGKISVLLLCIPVMEGVFEDIAEMFSGI
jgi:stage III sporulation protein AD